MYTLLILFFGISIIVSFLCSLWEAVLLSVTPSYAEIRMKEGSATGRQLHRFKEDIDRPLAAILTLNTIAHTVGAIGVGVQATTIWGDTNPVITGFVVPALMTLAILVLSEIIPKTMGAIHWQRLSGFTVQSLAIIIWILYPFVSLSRFVTALLKRDTKANLYTRSDFQAMAEIGARNGVIRNNESEIIGRLLSLNEVVAENIMTPRTVVLAAAESTPIHEFLSAQPGLGFSRIPIFQGSKDHVTGYVLKDELLDAMVNGRGEEELLAFRRDIPVIPERHALPELFHRFLQRREHIAIVADEFGGMAGIVTMEDVIETLLGHEILDELDRDVDMQVVARRNWEKRARSRGLVTPDFAELARSRA